MSKVIIDSFTGAHAFLSNFSKCEIELRCCVYPSVEHAYQAAKTRDLELRKAIRFASTPAIAKRLGSRVPLRPGWDGLRLSTMEKLLRQKFSVEPNRSLLLGTGDATLVEGNWWRDEFWGVCRRRGENNLGKLLMKLRAELQRGGEL